MKSFLEEYGFAILAAIIVIVLIMMVSPVGTAVRGSVDSIVHKFTGTANNGLDSATGKFEQTLNNIQEEGNTYYADENEDEDEDDFPAFENGVLYKFNTAQGRIGYFTKDQKDGSYLEYEHFSGVLKPSYRFRGEEKLVDFLKGGEVTVEDNSFTITRYSKPSSVSVGDMSFGWSHIQSIGSRVYVCPIASDEQKDFFESTGENPLDTEQDLCLKYGLDSYFEWDDAGYWNLSTLNPLAK